MVVNSLLHHIKMYIGGTHGYEQEWASRTNSSEGDWNDNKDWIRGYWESINHPHRKFLTDAIVKSNPKSVLEIGCNCGPNLRLLAKRLPDCKFVGIDINPSVIQKGNEWFKEEGITNVELFQGKIEHLSEMFGDQSFDVVFTDAVLIYIGLDQIWNVLRNFIRIANHKIILLEWCPPRRYMFTRGKYLITKGLWAWDFKYLFNQIGLHPLIWRLPVDMWDDKHWQKYGCLIEVNKSGIKV